MPPLTWDSHTIVDIVLAVSSLGWFVIGLRIAIVMGQIRNTQLQVRISQLEDKADLVQKQMEIKDALTMAHNTSSTKLDIHIAEDLQKFDSLAHSLTKIDTKLDGLAVIGLTKPSH